MIEDPMIRRVEPCLAHFGGHGHPDSISDALTERTGRSLNSGGLAKLWMPWRLAVQLTKSLNLLQRQIESGEMQPTVKKHAAMSGGENKSIPIDPVWVIRIESQDIPKQHSSDLGIPEGQAKVS
jgi:hypothetical protein